MFGEGRKQRSSRTHLSKISISVIKGELYKLSCNSDCKKLLKILIQKAYSSSTKQNASWRPLENVTPIEK